MRGCKSKVKKFSKTPQNGDFYPSTYCILFRVGTSFFCSPLINLKVEVKMTNLQIQIIKLADIRAYKNNPKLHNKAHVAKIRESIREFGFINPVLLDENLEIIAGHGRVAAAVWLNC